MVAAGWFLCAVVVLGLLRRARRRLHTRALSIICRLLAVAAALGALAAAVASFTHAAHSGGYNQGAAIAEGIVMLPLVFLFTAAARAPWLPPPASAQGDEHTRTGQDPPLSGAPASDARPPVLAEPRQDQHQRRRTRVWATAGAACLVLGRLAPPSFVNTTFGVVVESLLLGGVFVGFGGAGWSAVWVANTTPSKKPQHPMR